MSNIATPSPNDPKRPSFLYSAAWLGIYTLLGVFVVSFLIRFLLSWARLTILTTLSLSQTEVFLWNLVGLFVGFVVSVIIFILISPFMSKKDTEVEKKHFVFSLINFLLFLLLGVLNILVMLSCHLTGFSASIICITIIFAIAGFWGLALFIIYLVRFVGSPGR